MFNLPFFANAVLTLAVGIGGAILLLSLIGGKVYSEKKAEAEKAKAEEKEREMIDGTWEDDGGCCIR